MSTEPMLNVTQVAERLSIAPKTVRDLARDGKLPFMRKVGGSWRAAPEALDRWATETPITEHQGQG